MSRESEIPPKSTAIIDSSVLFAMGGPDNAKYSAFEEFVTGHGLAVEMEILSEPLLPVETFAIDRSLRKQ